MINMLIVDDEPLMREGLSYIPWESAGICLVGAVSNGIEALTVLKNTSVQILFTDIQMPDISGLELIRAALIIHPNIRSVILSGHNQFEYAKEAISLHVYDYILKPCDPDEVLATLGKLAAEITATVSDTSLHAKSSQNIQNTLNSVLNHIFTTGSLTIENELFLRSSFFFTEEPYFIACCSCNPNDFSFFSTLGAEMDTPWFHILSVPQTNNRFLLLLQAKCEVVSFQTSVLSQLQSAVQKFQEQHRPLKIAVGSLALRPAEILTAYISATECFDFFFSHENEDFLCADFISVENISQATVSNWQGQLLSYTEQMNYQQVDEILISLESFFASSWIIPKQIRLTAINLLLLSSGLIAQKKNDAFSGLTAEQLLLINQSCSLSELFAWMRETFHHCITVLGNVASNSTHHLVRECLSYIEQHHTEDISISTAASCIHVNPDYLSRLLKKEYGLPFGQILTNFRLETACSLLSDFELPISEVSSLSGFNDFRYFGQVFKIRYKMTPREYRKIIKKNC